MKFMSMKTHHLLLQASFLINIVIDINKKLSDIMIENLIFIIWEYLNNVTIVEIILIWNYLYFYIVLMYNLCG